MLVSAEHDLSHKLVAVIDILAFEQSQLSKTLLATRGEGTLDIACGLGDYVLVIRDNLLKQFV